MAGNATAWMPVAVMICAVVARAGPGHQARYQPRDTVAVTAMPLLRSILTAVTLLPTRP
jgi:hypothetical protein